MQPAFPVFGIFPPPAARTNVFARLDGAGARLATLCEIAVEVKKNSVTVFSRARCR
jgi:hypothetical protein